MIDARPRPRARRDERAPDGCPRRVIFQATLVDPARARLVRRAIVLGLDIDQLQQDGAQEGEVVPIDFD